MTEINVLQIVIGLLITISLGLAAWSFKKTIDLSEKLIKLDTQVNSISHGNDKFEVEIKAAIEKINVKLDKLLNKEL
jgi:hypothetical protein